MKNIILVTIAISLLTIASVADAAGCKYKQNEIDLFTKEKLVRTDWFDMTSWISGAFNKTIGNRHELSVAAAGEGPQNFVLVNIKLSDTTRYAPDEEDMYHALLIPKGATLSITLADESVIELHAIKEVRGATRAKYDQGTFVISTKFTNQYRLGADAADALTSQDAIYIRLAASSRRYEFVSDAGTIDFKVNKKGNGAFKQTISCLQKA
jgi:hypothetical protein